MGKIGAMQTRVLLERDDECQTCHFARVSEGGESEASEDIFMKSIQRSAVKSGRCWWRLAQAVLAKFVWLRIVQRRGLGNVPQRMRGMLAGITHQWDVRRMSKFVVVSKK